MVNEDKENETEVHSDSGSGSGSGSGSPRIRRNSSGRLAPREGQLLNKKIQEHAIEVDEVLHSSMEEEEFPTSTSLVSTNRKLHSIQTDLPSSTTNSQYSTENMIMANFQPKSREKKFRHLGKAKSTPLSLNQIHEERESDLEDSPVSSPRVERTRKHLGGGIMKSKRTTRRLSPVHSGGSRRSSSCSSSDEDDIEKHMRRLKTNSSCKLSSRRGNPDDGSSDGDNGGDAGFGGAGGLGSSAPAFCGNGSRGGQTSSNNNQPCKGEGRGKTNNLNLSGLVPLCENLDVISESDKENVSNGNESGAGVKIIDSNERRTPLIEEYDVLCKRTDEIDDRNGFCREKRNSAIKYIQTSSDDDRTLSDQPCNGKHNMFVAGVTNMRLTDLSPHARENQLVDVGGTNKRVLHNPTVQSVTSNCCQIF